MVSTTNSTDSVANIITLIDKDKVIYLKDICLSTLDAFEHVVGLPVEPLNFLQHLAEGINSDANCSILV